MTIRLSAADAAGGDVYDLDIACCDSHFLVRREHETMRRLEQVAGPLMPLVDRLQAGAITQSDLERVYRTLLERDPAAPGSSDIRAWLFATGTSVAARAIAADVLSLVLGNAALRLIAAAERREADAAGSESGEEVDEASRPFSQAAP